MRTIAQHFFILAFPALVSVPALADHHDESQVDNIVDTAAAVGQFETLLAAASEAGLASALANDGPFTVFAPTDTAFGTLPTGTVERLLQPENQHQLAGILKFHVVPGRVGSDALADGATLKTLAGPRMTVTQSEQGFNVEGARILTTDIEASNGIVHIIDRVITPPDRMSRAQARRSIEHAIARGVENTKSEITYQKGEEVEVMIPIVFSDEDIGLAYGRTVTGLKGDRVLENESIDNQKSTEIIKDISRFRDDFILNVTGTGQGMYDRKIKARDEIRRATLLIAKINKTSQNKMTVNWGKFKNTEKSLLLTGMKYGNGLSISLSGKKSIFTEEAFGVIKQKFESGMPITDLLKKYNLTPTFDLRGIRSKGRQAEIPTSWEDLKSKYKVLNSVPIVGRYLLLEDINAKTFDWN